jgi:hypothetical protein
VYCGICLLPAGQFCYLQAGPAGGPVGMVPAGRQQIPAGREQVNHRRLSSVSFDFQVLDFILGFRGLKMCLRFDK